MDSKSDHFEFINFQLARQGLNVVIMSCSEENLQKVAEEIREYVVILFTVMLKF
jgi:short-subunit dehydrogenase